MVAAITGCTTKQMSPNAGCLILQITTPSTADSADTLDVSSATATGGQTLATIYGVIGAYDSTSADAVTATWSGTTITIDAAGGTSNHTYRLLVWGQ